VFRAESGRELFDLPGAPRPDPDTPAPVRFLPEYDNLLLAHADRTHVMEAGFGTGIFLEGGRILGSVLVDGTFSATWRVDGGTTLVVQPRRRLSTQDTRAVGSEGRRMLGFLLPDPTGAKVRVEPFI
jgi:DNA glycosylase AlkZ-like